MNILISFTKSAHNPADEVCFSKNRCALVYVRRAGVLQTPEVSRKCRKCNTVSLCGSKSSSSIAYDPSLLRTSTSILEGASSAKRKGTRYHGSLRTETADWTTTKALQKDVSGGYRPPPVLYLTGFSSPTHGSFTICRWSVWTRKLQEDRPMGGVCGRLHLNFRGLGPTNTKNVSLSSHVQRLVLRLPRMSGTSISIERSENRF